MSHRFLLAAEIVQYEKFAVILFSQIRCQKETLETSDVSVGENVRPMWF